MQSWKGENRRAENVNSFEEIQLSISFMKKKLSKGWFLMIIWARICLMKEEFEGDFRRWVVDFNNVVESMEFERVKRSSHFKVGFWSCKL